MPKRRETKKPSVTPSRVVSAVPDLSPDQRRDLRSRNVETILSHPKLVNGQLTDHLVETALGNNPDASPSERNQAMTVVASAMYGKNPGEEETKPQAPNITLSINGQLISPSTGKVLEQSAEEGKSLSKEEEVMALINGTSGEVES